MVKDVEITDLLSEAGIGFFQISIDDGLLTFDSNEALKKIFDIFENFNMEKFLNKITSTDRQYLEKKLYDTLKNGEGFSTEINLESDITSLFKRVFIYIKAKPSEFDFYELTGVVKEINIEDNKIGIEGIVHELKLPVNSILGMINFALSSDEESIKKDYLQKTKSSAQNLLNIVNNSLDSFKDINKQLEKINTPFNLKKILKEVYDIVSFQIYEKNLNFHISGNLDFDVNLIGDEQKLKQVLINLIGNSIKFTTEGFVKLIINEKFSNDDSMKLEFIVKDTGIGIKEGEIEKIFMPYSQANSKIFSVYGGTGLGLFISKKYIELMGGELWCDSTFGIGAEFGFDLSFENCDECKKNTLDKEKNTSSISTRLKNKKILIADDNEINCLIIKEILKNEPVDITFSNDGKSAIELILKENFDFILMDINMPEYDGFKVSEMARKNKILDVPIIAMTAYNLSDNFDKLKYYGMNDFLKKPIEVDNLYRCLDNWI